MSLPAAARSFSFHSLLLPPLRWPVFPLARARFLLLNAGPPVHRSSFPASVFFAPFSLLFSSFLWVSLPSFLLTPPPPFFPDHFLHHFRARYSSFSPLVCCPRSTAFAPPSRPAFSCLCAPLSVFWPASSVSRLLLAPLFPSSSFGLPSLPPSVPGRLPSPLLSRAVSDYTFATFLVSPLRRL